MGCLKLTYNEKEDLNFFQGLWKKSDGSKKCDNYYPFGLTFNSYQRENSVPNKIKFQGQEHVDDLGLNWDSFKWRNHQPDIGRFFNVDPLAEKYYYNSPYAFSENKVVAHVELEGLESAPYPLKQEIAKVESTLKSIWNDAKISMSKALDAITPDRQVGKTDIEKKNSKPEAVDDEQRDHVKPTSTPTGELDGNLNPQFNPKGTPTGQGGEDIMMAENGQKAVKNPDKSPGNVTIDTVGTSGNSDKDGNKYNAYYVIQNGQDTIDQRHYVPSNLMPKKVVPASTIKN
jgi:RHS repeat-associated protein